MALRFGYPLFPTPNPIVSLSGRGFRPRPVIPVGIFGPAGGRPVDALVDTGSDDTTFQEAIARQIGIDLTNAPTRNLTGIGPSGYVVRYAQVQLRLSDGIEFRAWTAIVGFTNAPLPLATLGFAGCLQYFTSTFRGDLEEVKLEINSLYPGT